MLSRTLADMGFDLSSRSRLNRGSLGRFPDDTLFHKAARVVCEAECLPRKELFEAWEVARRARRRMRGGRVVDLACGHGLVAIFALLLDDSSPLALAVDRKLPKSAPTLHRAFVDVWPRLEGRLVFEERDLGQVELHADDLVLSAHACGTLTDLVIERALEVRARVAVLPCCHDAARCDDGGLGGWLDAPLAIDVTRAARLRARGYEVRTQVIPEEITPKNRLLLGSPGKIVT